MRPAYPRPSYPRPMYRAPDVQGAMGIGRSALYERIANGLMPPPVKVGPRVSAWPCDEIEVIQRAVIAGATDDQLRELVRGLIRRRVSAMPEVPP